MSLEIPYDAISTIYIFMVGVIPQLVLQTFSPEFRRILSLYTKFWVRVLITLSVSLIIVGVSITAAYFNKTYQWNLDENMIWGGCFFTLFVFSAYLGIVIPEYYGDRENFKKEWTHGVLKKYKKKRFMQTVINDVIKLGVDSSPGWERQNSILALSAIAETTLKSKDYHGDSLNELISGSVKMLTANPEDVDIYNFEITLNMFFSILLTINLSQKNVLADQNYAISASSVLIQRLLAQNIISVGLDHIVMDYVEVLGLAVKKSPAMLSDVTQSMLEVGSVALDQGYYLVAVAFMEKLLSIVEDQEQETSNFVVADLLGLAAHFWVANESSKEFIKSRIPRIRACLKDSLRDSTKKAKIHSQVTMRFNTVSKLTQMEKDLETQQESRKKKVKTKRKN